MRIDEINHDLISTSAIFKCLDLIREFAKNEDFLKINERILEKLIEGAFYLIENLDKNSNYKPDSISAILSFVDFLQTKNSSPTFALPASKIHTYVQAFKKLILSVML